MRLAKRAREHQARLRLLPTPSRALATPDINKICSQLRRLFSLSHHQTLHSSTMPAEQDSAGNTAQPLAASIQQTLNRLLVSVRACTLSQHQLKSCLSKKMLSIRTLRRLAVRRPPLQRLALRCLNPRLLRHQQSLNLSLPATNLSQSLPTCPRPPHLNPRIPLLQPQWADLHKLQFSETQCHTSIRPSR